MNRLAIAVIAIGIAMVIASPSFASEPRDYKRDAAIWYQAFSAHDPRLLGTVLAEDWYETPSAERGGREVGMKLLVSLTTVFPDFRIEIKDMVQEGNKVVVRSEITGTQTASFMGFPSKNRRRIRTRVASSGSWSKRLLANGGHRRAPRRDGALGGLGARSSYFLP